MTWVYNVKSKAFSLNGLFQFSALYAGAEGYKNDTDYECAVNRGPLPRGKYRIGRPLAKHESAGLYVLPLTPHRDNAMCGRAGFLIHGDNGKGTASTGCIVASLTVRQKIAASGDRELIVQ
ncbi:tlde1 domain-containing protein [Pantoea vagans]|uniref:tlde1 domain-containing protein n=1 Tax=Pantoea vagans TaxID=470934 RepID=UPI003B0127D2